MTGTPADEPEAKRIVVGVDSSEESILALRWAVEQASLTGAVVEAVMAWDFPPHNGILGRIPWTAESLAGDVAAEALADAIMKAVGAEPPVDIRAKVVFGSPAKVLVKASADAEHLVVGNRGRGSLAGELMGSVSLVCAHHAHCPVTIIHGERYGSGS